MQHRNYFIAPIAVAISLLVSGVAQADGTVSYQTDVLPLMKGRPFFADYIAKDFTVSDGGEAVRINSPTMPNMTGERIGPYRFHAVWHSAKGDVPVTLIIDTQMKFFDPSGHEIMGNDLTKTAKITQTLDSIEVEAPSAYY